MEDRTKTTISNMHSKVRFWCWAILIIALAFILAVIIFHLAYWLMLIGAVTVIALALALGFYAERVVHKIKDAL